jgi:hypothetical protein
MSLRRIEAITREQYETGAHGARHLMLGLDVYEALKVRAAPGREPSEVAWIGGGPGSLMAIPIIIADEDTLRADEWCLRENTGRAEVERGSIGDPRCTHEHSLDITEQQDTRWRIWCVHCGAEWTESRGKIE